VQRLQYLVDSSVLIDLGNGGVLPQLFQLDVRLAAPELVLDELMEPDREQLQAMGLERVTLTPEELLEAQSLAAEDRRLSVADCAALIAARNKAMTLLTGDRRLRRMADMGGVPVHGALWVLDQIAAANLLGRQALAVALRKLLISGARLPTEACERRLRRWEARGR
jgi:predicted nucleic acid-binding protein